jgi:hypothetical protein
MTSNEPGSKESLSVSENAATVEYDWGDGDQPTTAIAETVGTATDRDPTALPPLHDYLDTEALNRVVTGAADGHGTDVRISFTYAGTEVFLDSEGLVTVRVTGDE